MGFVALDHSVSIIALEKNGKKYGMCCAWFMQVDYDKVVCLLGSQSVTGAIISKNDKVGLSVLSKKQKNIAEFFGSTSSKDVDKFGNVDFVKFEDGAICILDSCRQLYCKVIDIIRLPEIEEDRLIYLKIEESICNSEDFLHYGDF